MGWVASSRMFESYTEDWADHVIPPLIRALVLPSLLYYLAEVVPAGHSSEEILHCVNELVSALTRCG